MSETTFTIGEVSTRAGINASAIRFYEREGVLPQPNRVAGQRRYSEETVRRLQVIAIAKRAGFNLDEVRLLLQDSAGGAQLSALARRKLPDVDALIARAEAMRDWLVKAQGCDCSSLELCDLFAEREAA